MHYKILGSFGKDLVTSHNIQTVIDLVTNLSFFPLKPTNIMHYLDEKTMLVNRSKEKRASSKRGKNIMRP